MGQMTLKAVLEDARVLLPEIVVTGVMILIILADLSSRLRKSLLPVVGVLGLVAAAWAAGRLFPSLQETAVFGGSFMHDRTGLFFRSLFAGIGVLAILFSAPVVSKWKTGQGEFYALLLATTIGMMFMAGANDFLMMYLALEFSSLTSYILSGFLRKNRRSAEASLKYIIYGAAASGFMVYGMTYLYGLTGTLEIHDVGRRMMEFGRENQQASYYITLVTSVLIMAGFAYKIAAVPFHMWCPDVYEGAPTPATAFFSVGPKAAGLAMLARFLAGVFPEGGEFPWRLVIAFISVLTMAVGNLGALQQQNLKRLFAYSSIAHSGYMLLAFTIFNDAALSAMIFYLFVYVMMNVGAFVAVIVLEEKYGILTVDECRGLGWRSPALGGLLTVFLFSLTGLPPTAGFVGKLLIFAELIKQEGPAQRLGIGLCVVAVLFTVISLYYYARIVGAMFLVRPREGASEEIPAHPLHAGLLWALAIGTILFGIFWGPLQSMAVVVTRGFTS